MTVMLLKINGKLNKYYLQTLCMLFYPGAKFGEDECDNNDESAGAQKIDSGTSELKTGTTVNNGEFTGSAKSTKAKQKRDETSDAPYEKRLLSAEFTRIDREDGVEVTCRFGVDGRFAEFTHFEPANGASRLLGSPVKGDEFGQAARMAAGIAALGAGKKLFGATPAWGLLTGIRPGKMAAGLLEERIEDEKSSRKRTPSECRAILTQNFLLTPRKAALAVEIAQSERRIAKLAIQDGKPTCSIYIGIPFCPSRCAYCSFVSYTLRKLLSLIPEYLDRICIDLADTIEYIRSRRMHVVSVYIGGGTPTTLNEQQLEKLLKIVSNGINTKKLAEFTLEAGRPDTITAEKLRIARENGVSRVSINPQTLNDTILRSIGRRHTVDDFNRAYALAKESGIACINTDLIAGLPGDNFGSFSKSIDGIIALEPENITVHTFCVKKSAEILKIDTEIYNRSAEETVKSVDYSQLRLKNAGYVPYYIYRQKNTVGNLENVGFSKRGAEGVYNVLMMEEMHSIFAVGAGAVTKLVRQSDENSPKRSIERIFEPKYPYEYLATDRNSELAKRTAAYDKFFDFEY